LDSRGRGGHQRGNRPVRSAKTSSSLHPRHGTSAAPTESEHCSSPNSQFRPASSASKKAYRRDCPTTIHTRAGGCRANCALQGRQGTIYMSPSRASLPLQARRPDRVERTEAFSRMPDKKTSCHRRPGAPSQPGDRARSAKNFASPQRPASSARVSNENHHRTISGRAPRLCIRRPERKTLASCPLKAIGGDAARHVIAGGRGWFSGT